MLLLRWIIFAIALHYVTAGKCRGHRTTPKSENCCAPIDVQALRINITSKAGQMIFEDNDDGKILPTNENSTLSSVGGDGECPTHAVVTCTTVPLDEWQGVHILSYEEGQTRYRAYKSGFGKVSLELNCVNGEWLAKNPQTLENNKFAKISCSQNDDIVRPGVPQ